MARGYECDVDGRFAEIKHTVETFGFLSTSGGKALGEILAEEVVEGIAARSVEQ